MMRVSFFMSCLALLLCAQAVSQQTSWQRVSPLPQGELLNAVATAGQDTLIAVGLNGTIIRSQNRGVTWHVSANTQGFLDQFNAVCFLNGDLGWVGGTEGTILKTTDGGSTWRTLSLPLATEIGGIQFLSATKGWVVGAGGIIYATTDGGESWIEQTSGLRTYLFAVQFLTPSVGYAVGASGKILKTTDGGTTWSVQTSKTVRALFGVYFTSQLTGWAYGASGTIMKTTNGGLDWTGQKSNVFSGINSAYFLDSLTGVTVGGFGIVLRTTNGGTNWIEQPSATNNELFGIRFTSATNGWVVGDYGVIMKTTNGGTSWRLVSSGPKEDMYAMHFPTPAVGYQVGDEGTIMKTTDGGLTWAKQLNTVIQPLYGVFFYDENLGWAVGDSGVILRTSNGGATWTPRTSFTEVILNSVHFITAEYGWAVGDEGTILRSINGGLNWVPQHYDLDLTFYKVKFGKPTVGLAVGYDGIVYRTTNSGNAWTPVVSETIELLYSIEFVGDSTVFSVGDFGTVIRSTNLGKTWTLLPFDTYESFYGVAFSTLGLGWICGDDGAIYRTTDAGVSWNSQAGLTLNTLWDIQLVRPQAKTLVAVGLGGTVLSSGLLPLPGKVWTGAIDSLWSNGGNWTPAGVPGSLDSVYIPSSARPPALRSVVQQIDLGALVIGSNGRLSIGKSMSRLSIKGNIEINGTLALDPGAETEIVSGGGIKFGSRGTFNSAKSTVILTDRSELRGVFNNVFVGIGADVQSMGNVDIAGSMILLGTLSLRELDTLKVRRSSSQAFLGNGLVRGGTVQRSIEQGSRSTYRFESPITSVVFNGDGSYPSTMYVSSFENTLPPGFSDSLFVRRFYTVGATGGGGYSALLSFRYDETETSLFVDDLSIFYESDRRMLNLGSYDFIDDEYLGIVIDSVSRFGTFFIGFTDYSPNHPFGFSSPLIVRDNGSGIDTLLFGASEGASAGVDTLLGERALNATPGSGTFDARWVIAGNVGTLINILPLLPFDLQPASQTYTVELQPGAGGYPFTLSWEKKDLPVGLLTLRDAATHGGKVMLNMKKTTTLVLTDPTVKALEIIHERATSYDFQKDWNLISLPFVPATSSRKKDNFPTALSNAFTYENARYNAKDTLLNGVGYWLKFFRNEDVFLEGTPALQDTIEIVEGWNIIGVLSAPVSVASVIQRPAGIAAGSYYAYANGYNLADSLIPSKGYWVKAFQAGTLILSTSLARESPVPDTRSLEETFNSITIADAAGRQQTLYFGTNDENAYTRSALYELPPPPPEGAFDARFESNLIVESLPDRLTAIERLPIVLRSVLFPVTVKFRIHEKGLSAHLVNAGTGKTLTRRARAGETELKITAAPIEKMFLVLHSDATQEIPRDFALRQNYPNPFNPQTTIQMELPVDALVSMKIFNILGQEVKVLADQDLFAAGIHAFTFDAAGFASGVYFYRMTAQENNGAGRNFHQVRKFMLLK